VSLPFDNAKTKIQKMKKDANGNFPYKNIFDAMQKTIVNEGTSKLWVGFPTFYFRIAPHVCITLVTQDFLTDTAKKLRAKKH
jgi:solute carrier family 25 oxoglutarate transporter 11